MTPWSLRLEVEAAGERDTADLNRQITAHYKGLVMEREKRPKKLDHYLIGQKSARARNEGKSSEQIWADLESLFGA